MIDREKPVTQTLSLNPQQFNGSRKPRKQTLVACWRKIDGKLICQWVLTKSISSNPNQLDQKRRERI